MDVLGSILEWLCYPKPLKSTFPWVNLEPGFLCSNAVPEGTSLQKAFCQKIHPSGLLMPLMPPFLCNWGVNLHFHLMCASECIKLHSGWKGNTGYGALQQMVEPPVESRAYTMQF